MSGSVKKKPKISKNISLGIKKILEYIDKEGVLVIIDSNPNSDSANMGTPYTYEKARGILTIITPNIVDLSKADKDALFEVIRSIHEDGYLIYKESKIEDIKSYKDYVTSKDNNDILKFFEGKIPYEDYFALKTSLFIEYLANVKGINIYSHKKDLRERFGPRGTNIANLCSANYFRDVFMPLYNECTEKEFREYYELAVGIRAVALFVNAHMSVEDISSEVNKMVDKAIRYGLDEFHIHGKGDLNVDNIKKFVANIDPEESDFIAYKENIENSKELKVIEFVIQLL